MTKKTLKINWSSGNPIDYLNKFREIKERFSLQEREEFFDSFNQRFQLEFMIFELSFVKLEVLFRYVAMADRILKQFFLQELGVRNCPQIGIELLISRKTDWQKVEKLEERYGIKVTSIHAPFNFLHDCFWGRIASKVFKEQLLGDFRDGVIKDVVRKAGVPITVHASQLKNFEESGLDREVAYRIENDSINPRLDKEDIERFCSIDSVIKEAGRRKVGVVFDTYHFYTYQQYLVKNHDPRASRIKSLDYILKKRILLGDKFHLSEGRNGSKRAIDRHISLLSPTGRARTRKFLEEYDFSRHAKNYMTLEISPLGRDSRMVPPRVASSYAKNFLLVINSLAVNMLEKNK